MDDDDRNKRKILLLGNGSSGKSTIFKQLKLILGDSREFDENELLEATCAIRQNCVSVLLGVLHKCNVLFDDDSERFADCRIPDGDPAVVEAFTFVMKYRAETFEKVEEQQQDLTELAMHIGFLWRLKCVQTTIKLRHKRFTVPDGMEYFYDSLDTVFTAGYSPSIEDILRLRIRTTGMIEQRFTILSPNHVDQYHLSLIDTGGERNERKKWVFSFESVDTVIFVAALSHFASVLWEDEKTLSLHDALELFAEICNGRWFKRSEMILFLNKDDLFRQMLYEEISLNVGFGDIREEDYCIDIQHSEITPPPSPMSPDGVLSDPDPDADAVADADPDGDDVAATGSDFPDFVDGLHPSPELQPDVVMPPNQSQVMPPPQTQTQVQSSSQSLSLPEQIPKQTASESFEIVDPSEDTKEADIEGEQQPETAESTTTDSRPYPNLNEWLGDKWKGPNFKYDATKSMEENNVFFEKCYDCAIEFIVSQFLKQNKDPNKTVYVHITTAVDEKNISDTFDEIRPLIIKSNFAGHCKPFF